jgi:probable HAF family extracellular repeat protein
MIAHIVSRKLLSIALVACCTIGIATAGAQNYTLIDLGVLPQESVSIPAALNDEGQVAGTSGASAFRYNSGAKNLMEDMGNPSTIMCRGFAINGSGQVVGDSTFGQSDVTHAAIFETDSTRDLAVSENPDSFSRASGINASGQVVGFFRAKFNGEFGRAFIANTMGEERRPTMVDLGTLGGNYAQALAINDSGFVTGNSERWGVFTIQKPGTTHAFIWNVAGKAMFDLGTLGGNFSYGTSINPSNHVAGYSTIDGSDTRIHAFLHDGKAMQDLGSLNADSEASDRSFALGVNSADQVVGYSYLPSSDVVVYPPAEDSLQQVAFVYSGGSMVDLNTRIGSASKQYKLHSATAINDKGQITAIAQDASTDSFHAVLLTPALEVPAGRPRRFSR